MACGHRHRLITGGRRAGFFLGDGTGVGKGRQIAGIILDNVCRGRKKALWVSTSPDLKNEAQNDFIDINAPGVLVKSLEDLDKAQGALGLSADFRDPAGGLVLFVSYASLIGSKVSQSNEPPTRPVLIYFYPLSLNSLIYFHSPFLEHLPA